LRVEEDATCNINLTGFQLVTPHCVYIMTLKQKQSNIPIKFIHYIFEANVPSLNKYTHDAIVKEEHIDCCFSLEIMEVSSI